MKIVTWNVNSIRTRLPRLLPWLDEQQPDILCLQETKVTDDLFPLTEIQEKGYQCYFIGQKTYNGVAIITRYPASDLIYQLPDDPPDAERRLIAAKIAGINIINVYVPNGSEVGSEKFLYKLEWYRRLRAFLDRSFKPQDDLLICGDFNVAPEDRDVWDVKEWEGKILFSPAEKKALRHLLAWGLTDTLRKHHAETGIYTWWDYRAGAFHRNWGLRIDHIFTSASLAVRSSDVVVDREARKGEKPSDHAPLIATFKD